MRFVFLGLSITSSWGNGHATTYRALVAALRARGHDVLFLERDVPWYAAQRDAPDAATLYSSLEELRDIHGDAVRDADVVVMGSYVPEGVAIGEWVTSSARGTTVFYDLDTPVTLDKLERRDDEYLSPALVGAYDLYLSFTGGRTLARLERDWGARRALPFYCVVDERRYFPEPLPARWALGYLGTYSDDRQPTVGALLLETARRLPAESFAIAGPQYPDVETWPRNVEWIEHLPPSRHRRFYCSQRLTLNVTRAQMVAAGWSPSVRLFEAAACAVPIVSDWWEGLDTFFAPGREILVASSTRDVFEIVARTDVDALAGIGERAQRRVLREHTAERRVDQLEEYLGELAAVTAA